VHVQTSSSRIFRSFSNNSLIELYFVFSYQVCAVKAPGFGDNRKATMQCSVISEDAGFKLDDIGKNGDFSALGNCKKITVTKNDTVGLDGMGEKAAIDERYELIRTGIETTKSDNEREKLQERLAKLSGGVAVIKVGGASEVECACVLH